MLTGNELESVLPLWKIKLQYYQTKSPAKTEALFENGLNAAPCVATALRPLYLEWLCLSRGIRDARAAYDRLCLQPPLSLDLHNKMASLEAMQTTAVMKHVRKCHENACNQFGKDNAGEYWHIFLLFFISLLSNFPTVLTRYLKFEVSCVFSLFITDVWMDYVKFEMKRGDPKNISNIYQRAVRQLEPIQGDIFVHEFSLVKTCMGTPQTTDA